jgi:hypothetical protein
MQYLSRYGRAPQAKDADRESVPNCGSYEVRYPNGRPSKCFYWERRPPAPDLVDGATAEPKAKAYARVEQERLDS